MKPGKFAIGVDFGSLSGRAMLVDVSNGKEIATAVHEYGDAVINECLPETDVRLESDWALQNPADYIEVFKTTIPEILRESGVDPANVIGMGVDFTACTMLPTKSDGTPLCFLSEWRTNPHAWVKLWKHHAAQPEANRINVIARETGFGDILDRYGGKINAEWFFPKAWQILNEAPDVYAAADRLIEAGDWIVWQLTGNETRSSSFAGYKAMWSKAAGFPPPIFFKALDNRLENIVAEKMILEVLHLGAKAGEISQQAASWTGLKVGTAVAVANIDAHVAVPAATVTKPGQMVMIMGTSICHMVVSESEEIVTGICGVVQDGILPNLFGYEAGQSCVGDHFQWFVENCVPESYTKEALEKGISIHQLLEEKASIKKPGESGLLALDWWNGNRSVLADGDLTGMILGMTLNTKPEEIYRALIEATAFSTRVIVETFEKNNMPIGKLIATGGLPDRNQMLMQIYSDVTGLPIYLPKAKQIGALGSAMYGAVAAGAARGGYDSIVDASANMTGLRKESFQPDRKNEAIYDRLFSKYVTLHDYFGRGENDVMKRLKALRSEMRASGNEQKGY